MSPDASLFVSATNETKRRIIVVETSSSEDEEGKNIRINNPQLFINFNFQTLELTPYSKAFIILYVYIDLMSIVRNLIQVYNQILEQ